jgi:hypothetical protein
MQSSNPDWRDPEEASRLCNEAFRRLLRMPPKPQEQIKLGKPRRRSARHERSDDSAGRGKAGATGHG